MTKPMEYTEDVDEGWAHTAMTSIKVHPVPDADRPLALDLDGSCPRCSDAMADTVWLVVISGLTPMSRQDKLSAVSSLRDIGALPDALLPAEFTVECLCTVPHRDPFGRKGLTGCGARWVMRFDRTEGG